MNTPHDSNWTYADVFETALARAMIDDPMLWRWRSHGRRELAPTTDVTPHAHRELLERRTWTAPETANRIASLATGAALAGQRLVVELGQAESLLESAEELVLELDELQRVSPQGLPLVLRAWMRATDDDGLGETGGHAMLLRGQSVAVVLPGDPQDAASLLPSALVSGKPTLFLEHPDLQTMQIDAYPEVGPETIGSARVIRPGAHVTVVSLGREARAAASIAEEMADEGVQCEWIDLRHAWPIDHETIIESVRKTGRLVVAEGGYAGLGIGAELLANVAEHALEELDAAPMRVSGGRETLLEVIRGTAAA